MAAYGAAVSLKNTIQSLLQSSRLSLDPASSEILQQVYDAMASLMQDVLLNLDDTGYSKIRTEVNALDEQIKEVVWEFEDLLESHIYDQILPQLESSPGGERDHLFLFVDLRSLVEHVNSFMVVVTLMQLNYDIELMNMPEEEGEPIPSRIDFGGINSKMVGLSDQFEQVRDDLFNDEGELLLVTGMAGVGKTTLVKKVFDDPSIQRHFEHRAWVKVGRKCELNETLRCILAQVDPNTHHQMLTQGDDDDDKLIGLLGERLKEKKCLIVLDDVWDIFLPIQVRAYLPKESVRLLLTSRIRSVKPSLTQVVRMLNKEESKKLLGEKVFGEKIFGEKGFPPNLEELGEKIAKKCEGLPLLIVTVAELLSKEEKTQEYWAEVAETQHNSIFVDAYDQISEVLFPSYDYLPQHLKMLFLYLGAFPPYCDIDAHTLLDRIIAEGFLERMGNKTWEDFMIEWMADLVENHNLLLFEFKRGSWFSKKMLRVHSCWQHVCKKEASKIKFLHVLQSCDDVLKDQRRLCAHFNPLFAFKEVYDSINRDCASTVRSLLCLGPYDKYPIPIHAMHFKLLRVLDVDRPRFYHIPLEIMKLVCLKYIALTCNKEIPISISNLFQLQFLIVNRYMIIKKRGALSYMPMEIWDMQELQHIQVMGRDLPIPDYNVTLDKLSSLFGVSVKSCSREILKRIPNLKELSILAEWKPYDDNDSNPLTNLGYISEELHNLESLSYRVVNPEMKYESTVPLSMFPSSLTKLELNGSGCQWKHMNDIGSRLPNLITLYLQHYAFRGPEWDIESGCFLKLETLVIADTDLVRLRPQHGSLPMLDLLSIRHCYKLKQLEWTRDPSMIKTTIELVECNPLVVASAKQLRPESLFTVRCHSSF
ncbi:putative late blight resistance protein homolog R1A-10 isoform X1 [Salvia hispanica]|uniref:putative late blight resistance protein homolog R1A-10 isoform X1 n=1 Tax=Salvia hispanica TaxID=49212 RepID=UPI00200950AB|nr:putative late blight resistance protein homolog R1A-10 isoform X1 [Salvia hispanica]